MRNSYMKNVKFVCIADSPKGTEALDTVEIRDMRDGSVVDLSKRPALYHFGDLHDAKESLEWCLNCDSSKTKVKWEMGTRAYFYLYD